MSEQGSLSEAREQAAMIVSLTEAESLSQDELDIVCDAAARLAIFAEWLVAMDDPEDVFGRSERQTVTLTQIIERAGKAIRGN